MRNVLNVKSLELVKIHTNKNVSDMLTKVEKKGMEALSFHVETKLTLKVLWVGQGYKG